MSIKIENTEITGWEAAIRGMRNPMNSWEKSDTWFWDYSDVEENDHCHSFNIPSATMVDSEQEGCLDIHWTEVQRCPEWTKEFEHIETIKDHPYEWEYGCKAFIGPNDYKLMMNLAKAGTTDAKYRRMINVTADVIAPLYWWKEYDTYKVGTVANSCSTMHKIHVKEFTRDDFSCEHLIEYGDPEEVPVIAVGEGLATIENEIRRFWPSDILDLTISMLNRSRQMFLETKDKRFWFQMIQLLPSSYNQRRTIQLNYEVLAAIYPKRKNHKLVEWHDFCDWIRNLPYSEIITLEDNNVQETL